MSATQFSFGIAVDALGNTLLPCEMPIGTWLRAAKHATDKRPTLLSEKTCDPGHLPHGRRYVCMDSSAPRRKATKTRFFTDDWSEAIWAGEHLAFITGRHEALIYAERSEWPEIGRALRKRGYRETIIEVVSYGHTRASGPGLDITTAFSERRRRLRRVRRLDSINVEMHRRVRYLVSL